MPQIEVTFDIDANGLLNVSAKDKGTGKEQSISITGASTLDSSEVDRMVSEAEKFADEDKERREKIERRNRADSLAYQAEKQIADNGDKIPADKKDNLQTLIVELRDAIQKEDDTAIQAKETALQEALYAISSELYQQAAPEGETAAAGASASDSGSSGGGDEDVIDAEFTES